MLTDFNQACEQYAKEHFGTKSWNSAAHLSPLWSSHQKERCCNITRQVLYRTRDMGHGITGKMTDMKFLWMDRTSPRGPQICCVFFWSRSREATGISTEQGIVFFSFARKHGIIFRWDIWKSQNDSMWRSPPLHLRSIFRLSLVSSYPLPSLLIHCFMKNSFPLLAAFVTRRSLSVLLQIGWTGGHFCSKGGISSSFVVKTQRRSWESTSKPLFRSH